jgi:hypothetical protein
MTTERITTDEQRQAAVAYQESALMPTGNGEPANIAALMELAISREVTPEALGKLVDLYERLDARRAAREFADALLRFQSDCPVIAKNRTADAGKYRYDYSSLDYLAVTIRPHLERHGISYTFDCALDGGTVHVVTILRHTGGHEERTTFAAPIDSSARMNPMQQAASATSYARRYGLLLALGLATGEDDDGRGSVGAFINEDQVQTLVDLIAESGANLPQFLKWMNVEQIAQIPERDYRKALRALEQKKRHVEAVAAKEWGTPTDANH